MSLIASVAATSPLWSSIGNIATIGNAATFLAILAGAFVVLRATSAKKQEVIDEQDAATLEALRNGLQAASMRADEEQKRADQQAALVSAYELHNAQLITSATEDQTRYMLTIKTLSKRIQELEGQNGQK